MVVDLFSPYIIVAGHQKHDEGASKNGGIKSSGPSIHTIRGRPAGRSGWERGRDGDVSSGGSSKPTTNHERSLPCVVVSSNCGRKRHWGRQTDTGPTGGTDT